MYCVLAQFDSISGLQHCSCRRIVRGVNCFCNDFSFIFDCAVAYCISLCFNEEISQNRISSSLFSPTCTFVRARGMVITVIFLECESILVLLTPHFI